MSNQTHDYRQRFFIQDSPVRGDIATLLTAIAKLLPNVPTPMLCKNCLVKC